MKLKRHSVCEEWHDHLFFRFLSNLRYGIDMFHLKPWVDQGGIAKMLISI